MFAGLRDTILKAGGPALESFNKRFIPAPKSLDSVAYYVLPPSEDFRAPIGAVVAGFNETFDQAKVLKSLVPNGRMKNHFGQNYIEDTTAHLAIKVIDNQTLLLSDPVMMPHVLSHEAKPTGAMSKHLSAAAVKPLYAAIDVAAIPKDNFPIPESLQPLTAAKEAVITGDLGKELSIKVQLKFPDAAAATAADKAARDGMQLARQQLKQMIEDTEKRVTKEDDQPIGLAGLPNAVGELFTLASLKSIDSFLDKPPLSKQGEALVFDYRFDPTNPVAMAMSSALWLGTALPATEAVAVAKTKGTAQNNLKQLALAMHNYHSTNEFMPAAIYSKDGKRALLSWRVAMLPFLEQEKLYKEFKLDEAWDSDHNKKLIAKMPDVFKDPSAPPSKEPGMTHYQVFVGGGSAFRLQPQSCRLFDITDGTSNTIMIVTTADPVTWTKPGDIRFDLSKPLPKLGLGGKPSNIAMFDGSVRAIGAKTSERTIKMAITAAGGELMPEEW
jgi:prepilin-type processing-associated H-X9-DG protein